MAVTMQTVRRALEPEEPDYSKAATLGPEALPHLEVLVTSGEPMLASKATYLASLIKHERAGQVIETAARSDDPTIRVAAAAAAANLASSKAQELMQELAADPDAGVRKVARSRRAKMEAKSRAAQEESPPTTEGTSA